MVGKITRGSDFKGLARYLTSPEERVLWVEGREVISSDPLGVAKEMEAAAARSSRTEKPVYHVSISFDPEDAVDMRQMREVANRILEDFGLTNHQVLIVAHRDTEHPHVHLMINRVHPETGLAWPTSHDRYRLRASLERIERELGLRLTGRNVGRERQREPAGYSFRQFKSRERTGRPVFADIVRAVAGGEFIRAESWKALGDALEKHGLELLARRGGMVVTNGERYTKASAVSQEASRPRLEKQLGPLPATFRLSVSARGPKAFARHARREVEVAIGRVGNWKPLEQHLQGRGLYLKSRGGEVTITDGLQEVRMPGELRGQLTRRFGETFEAHRSRLAIEVSSGNGSGKTSIGLLKLARKQRALERFRENPEEETARQAGRMIRKGVASAFSRDKAVTRTVRTLRIYETVMDQEDRLYATRQGRLKAREKLEKAPAMERGASEARRAFEEALRAVYRDPGAGQRAFEAFAQAESPRRAADHMRSDPERFGRLRVSDHPRLWGFLRASSTEEARQLAQTAAHCGEEWMYARERTISAGEQKALQERLKATVGEIARLEQALAGRRGSEELLRRLGEQARRLDAGQMKQLEQKLTPGQMRLLTRAVRKVVEAARGLEL